MHSPSPVWYTRNLYARLTAEPYVGLNSQGGDADSMDLLSHAGCYVLSVAQNATYRAYEHLTYRRNHIDIIAITGQNVLLRHRRCLTWLRCTLLSLIARIITHLPQYQFLKTISQQDPNNIIIGLVRSTNEVDEKVSADGLKNVHIIHGDMDSNASLTAAAKKTAELTGGALDYLIVNGVYASVPAYVKTVDDWIGAEQEFLDELKQSMQTNVGGTLFAFNAFMPLILKSDIKRVTAISSAAAARDYIFEGEDMKAVHYATSKAALNTLVAKFAARYKHDGVIFVSISPGFVNTHPDLPEEMAQKMFAPLYRWDETLKGPMPPVKSVEMCLKVIDGVTHEQSGEFLSQHGNTVWLENK